MQARVVTVAQKPKPTLRNNLWRGRGIITYDQNNDYPQRVRRILDLSPTGTACRNTLADFIEGQGFENESAKQLCN